MPQLSIMIKPVSGMCNMRCSYCFYADEMQHRQIATFPAMTSEILENLIRRAFAYADESTVLAFQVGEPTLAGTDFYRRVLALERKYNSRRVRVTHALQSNGLLITDDLISVLREGKFLIGLSVDGTQQIHDSRRLDTGGQGTHERIMRTAQRLKKNEIDYNILCVVDRQVAQKGKEVFEALKAHEYMQFIPRLEPLDGKKDENSLTARTSGVFFARFIRAMQRCFAWENKSASAPLTTGCRCWLAIRRRIAAFGEDACPTIWWRATAM